MKVYHGSYTKIDKVDIAKCEPNKDFGQGFYVTNIHKQAVRWAEKIGNKHHTQGVVTEFEFNERAWEDNKYGVLRFNDYTEEWLDFVVMNRDDSTIEKRHSHDLVEGPVADDKIQRRLDRYLQGKIPKSVFLEELRYYEPTHQICFCTLHALQMLKHTDEDFFADIEDIGEPLIENLIIELGTPENEAYNLFYNSGTFTRLADKSTSFHGKPWQEIYDLLKQELKDSQERA
jgi:hypothetical protein